MKMKRLCALLLAVVLMLGLCSCSIGKRGKYEKAVEAVRNGHYTEAIESLEALEGYEDSAKYIAYARAIQAGDSGDYEAAIEALEALNGFEKSAVYIASYTTLAAEAEQARIKSAYDQAISDVRAGEYEKAILVLESLNDYEDSAKYIAYARALQTGDSGDYEAAIEALEALNGFEKSAVYITSYTALAYEAEQVRIRSAYNQAIADVMAGRYDAAISTLETLNGYEDSGKYIMYARSLKAGDSGDYETAIKSLSSLGYFKETGMYIQYYTALRYEAEQKYEEAGEVYDGILLFKDVQARNAALPDKILDRDLAEAERALEQEYDWSPLREMVKKTYTTSETRMYENILAYAEQLHERQAYKNAMKVCMLLLENGYKKAETGLKKSAYQLAREWMADGAYADARYIINEYIPGYKDTDEMVKECDYQLALKKQAGGAENARAAYNAFKALGDYRDSAARAAAYETKYAEAVAKREANDFDGAIALFSALGTYSDSAEQIKKIKYTEAVAKRESGDFDAAIALFAELDTYSDSATKREEAQNAKAYAAAVSLMNCGKYEAAIKAFRVLNGYSDSAAQIEACETAILEREYQKAIKLADEGKRNEAIRLFRSLNGYKDSNEQIRYQQALQAESEGAKHAQTAYDAFKALGTYKDSAEHAAAYETKYAKAVSERESGDFDVAIALFTELGTYSDSAIKREEAQNAKAYADAVSLMNSEKYEEAIKALRALNGYSDSAEQITECTYRTAEKLRGNGKYDEAFAIYVTIRGYKDVSEILTNDTNIAKAVRRAEYQPGNYVTFGTYPQTKSGSDQTPIEWLVLESDGETALLISRYALDAKPYNNKGTDITWEKCTLRRWLNNDFYNRAFSTGEKKAILKSDVSADKNPSYSTNPGNATKDSVFLLSIVEAKKYFANNEARMCAATDYAIKQGTYVDGDYTVDGRKACWWWLRSPAYDGSLAAFVFYGGSIVNGGYGVIYCDCAVRPCVWVRLF